MSKRFEEKVALVTGCGAVGPGWGNGKATAVLFAREGARVFGCDINLQAAEEVVRQLRLGHASSPIFFRPWAT